MDPDAGLSPLAPLMRREPALPAVMGLATATLAVPAPAQAFALAGLARLSERHPVVVVTATGTDAERLAADIACFFPSPAAADGERVIGDLREPVVVLPAWETLPFERVSPDVGTMGRRLAVQWHLLGDAPTRPRVVVAPVRAVLQRLAPWQHESEPIVVTRGAELNSEETVRRLVEAGYRREHQVEHRGEVAVRGGIIDVFPATAEVPVRIDLWGDEVDRLTAFDVGTQRSVEELDAAVLFACRELSTSEEVRRRAAVLADTEPWGRSQWERLAAGVTFDGMESWLPWLHADELILTDLLAADAQVVLVDPRRVRDRSVEVYEEEGALAETLASTWGVAPSRAGEALTERFPRLHLPFDRLLAHCDAAVLSVTPAPEGPSVAGVTVRGFEPIAGDAERLGAQMVGLVADGYSVTLCAGSRAGAERLSNVLAEVGIVDAPCRTGRHRTRGPGGGGPALRRFRTARAAGGRPVRVRRHRPACPHRRARPRARPTDGFFDDLAPGSFVVHRQHGVARFAGVTTRTIGGATRDYLLLEYRGNDRLYLPVDQIEAVTPYTGGESPTLSRMGGAEWQRARARARAAAGEVAEELVELYRRRLAVPGHAFSPDTPWQREVEASFPFVETPDQLRAIEDVKADMEQPRPMDRLVCGDVGFGKTEVAMRAAFKAVQDGMQVAVLVPTTLLASQHLQTFCRPLRRRSRCGSSC